MFSRNAVTAGRDLDDGQRSLLDEAWAELEVGVMQEVKSFALQSRALLSLPDRGLGSTLDANQWEDAQMMLVQAKQAFEKLCREAQKLHEKVAGNKQDSLWQVLRTTQLVGFTCELVIYIRVSMLLKGVWIYMCFGKVLQCRFWF